jgi:gliding motility-associated lipoprotein GldH
MNKTKKITTTSKFVLLLSITCLMVSCNRNDVYLQYRSLPTKGWNKDSVLTFDVPITDTTSLYNVYVNIRHRGEYPYQNLWFFLRQATPLMDTLQKDTIECYLADQRGKWLGSGVGSVYEMPILYRQKVSFPRAGIYRYQIIQGMRDSILAGINDVGIKIEKVK